MKTRISRGIKNNNPLNIRLGSPWKGLCKEQKDKAFCQFQRMEWGLRAAFCLLHTYAEKHRLSSIKDIISRWAPPSENDTTAYVRQVCLLTGFGGNQRLTEAQWPRLVKAMAKIESGAELTDELLEKAFTLYKH